MSTHSNEIVPRGCQCSSMLGSVLCPVTRPGGGAEGEWFPATLRTKPRGQRGSTQISLGCFQNKSVGMSFVRPILERLHASQRSPEVSTTHHIQQGTGRRIKLAKKDCVEYSLYSMDSPWLSPGVSKNLKVSTHLGEGSGMWK